MIGNGISGWERARALMMALLMLASTVTAMLPGASGSGMEDGIAGAPPEQMDYGQREKDLTFQLHSINASETSLTIAGHTTDLYMDTTLDFNGTSVTYEVTSSATYTWYLSPVLAGDLNVSHFAFKIWIWATSTLGTPQGNLSVNVYEVTTTSWTHVAGNHTGTTNFLSTADLRVVTEDFQHVFKAGSTIVVNMTLVLTAGDSMHFAFDTPKANSRFLLRTMDGATLEDVYTVDYNGYRNSSFEPTEADKTVHMRANVSDELGGYDIKWVNVTLSSGGSVILDNVTMTRVSGSDMSHYSIYERDWNYTGYPSGRYDYTIWITDNSGHNHYYHLQMYVWDNYTSEKSSHFTIGKMVYVNVKVLDSMSVPLVGAWIGMLYDSSGTFVASATTNGTGMFNFTTVFTGSYKVVVIWQRVEVANVSKTISQNVSENNPLIIDAAVYYPTFKIVDDKGIDLEDASVFLGSPNGSLTAIPYRTNSTGEFNLSQVAGGQYRLNITWMDVLVNTTAVDVTSNGTITVYTNVFYLEIKVVDSRAAPLAGAQVVLANSTSGIVFDSKITNLSGGYEFRLPLGDYDISVYWQNSVIHSQANYTHSTNALLTLIGEIYYLVVRVLDTHDIPVESAQVVVAASEGNVLDSNFTDEQGRIDSRLPRGTHWVSVYWLGVLTNRTQVTFTDDSQVTVVASIFYPTFRFLDADGGPVGNARVDLRLNETGEVLESVVTDENGTILVRLPAARYDISVYWKGVQVFGEAGFMLSEDHNETRTVSVYSLELICLDSRDAPLKDARVTVALSSNGRELASVTTDGNGTVMLRLPGAAYDVDVWWRNTHVANEEGFLLGSSGAHTIHCSVFYVDGKALDSRDKGIDGAMVEVTDAAGKVVNTLLADFNGSFQLRLPISEYGIAITWKGRTVNTTTLVLGSDITVDFWCSVFYLKLAPLDSKGRFVKDATVTVVSVTSEKAVATDITGLGGTTQALEFRLPSDTYDIMVVWRSVVVNTTSGLILASDIQLDLDCAIFYLEVIVLDSKDNVVQDAQVELELLSTGGSWSGTTDNMGSATFRLPTGPYGLSIKWKSVTVHTASDLELSADDTWTVNAAIYFPELALKDSRGANVGGAHIDIFLATDGTLLGSADMSEEGLLVVRLPGTSYRIVCTWIGHKVLDTVLEIGSNGEHLLQSKVYYFEPEVLDSKGLALEDAIVDMAEADTGALLGTAVTGPDGKASIRLPIGDYSIHVTWRTVGVYDQDILHLTSDVARTIDANVHYLTIDLDDDRKVPVQGALVDILKGEDGFESGISPSTGAIIFRLPEATYDAVVTWGGILVGTQEGMVLDRDLEAVLALDIFYLTVKVRDSEGADLKGALVTVLKGDVDVFGSGQTKGDGTTEMRLPVGTYNVKVRYSSTYMMSEYTSTLKKDVDLTSSMDVKFAFSDYPPPIYSTNTFAVSVLSIILVLLIVVAAIKLLRPRK